MNIDEVSHAILHIRNKIPYQFVNKSYIHLAGLRLNMARINQNG